jgi:hypothetical protein
VKFVKAFWKAITWFSVVDYLLIGLIAYMVMDSFWRYCG